MTFSAKRNPMGKKDALPLLLVTAAYACTAFFQLGSFTNPQSFQSFDETATVEFSLDRTVALTRLGWYTGLGTETTPWRSPPTGKAGPPFRSAWTRTTNPPTPGPR